MKKSLATSAIILALASITGIAHQIEFRKRPDKILHPPVADANIYQFC